MKKTIQLTESELHGLIRECIEEIIYESRQPLAEAFQSKKLQQLIQQHGGLMEPKLMRIGLSDFKDSEVVGVFDTKDEAAKAIPEGSKRENDWILKLKDGKFLAFSNLGSDRVIDDRDAPFEKRRKYHDKYGTDGQKDYQSKNPFYGDALSYLKDRNKRLRNGTSSNDDNIENKRAHSKFNAYKIWRKNPSFDEYGKEYTKFYDNNPNEVEKSDLYKQDNFYNPKH